MIQIVDVTVHEVAFRFSSLPIPPFPLFKATLEAKFRPDHFPVSQKPPTHDVERFLSMPRFDSREKMTALGCYIEPEASKTGLTFESNSLEKLHGQAKII